MYLYLGQDAVVRGDDIIGIFDLENTTISKHTRNYLNRVSKEQKVIDVTQDLPKGFVVCSGSRKKEDSERVYITQMAPSTLKKRAKTYSYGKEKD